MNLRIHPWTSVRIGEWQRVRVLFAIIGLNMMMSDMTDTVSTAGFIKSIGPQQIFWLWMPILVLGLALTAALSLIIDRYARRIIVASFAAALGVGYLACLACLGLHVGLSFVYSVLYVLMDQQMFLFPAVFWSLANDAYRTSESKRLFPTIAAGASAGSIVGNLLVSGLASVFAHHSTLVLAMVLSINVAACAVVVRLALAHGRGTAVRAAAGTPRRTETVHVRAAAAEGWDFVKNVPGMRYLALGIVLLSLGAIMFEYHLLAVVSLIPNTTGVERYLGLFRMSIVVATLLLQWFVSARWLQQIELKRAFMVYPLAMVGATAVALAVPGLFGATTGPFVSQSVKSAWDGPARNTFQGMIADDRRGRVTMFLESYLPTIGSFLACVVMALVSSISILGIHWPQANSQVTLLIITGCLMLAAGWSMWRLRQLYDQSLLNWRFSRKRRVSALDTLDL